MGDTSMAMTLEEFDAMPGHMELPYDEREELKRMYGVPAEVMRVVQTSESGRIIRKRGVGQRPRQRRACRSHSEQSLPVWCTHDLFPPELAHPRSANGKPHRTRRFLAVQCVKRLS